MRDFILWFNTMIDNIFRYFRPHGILGFNARSSCIYLSNIAKEIWINEIEPRIQVCCEEGHEYCCICGESNDYDVDGGDPYLENILGTIIGCSNEETCDRFFHFKCHQPNVTEAEEKADTWFCKECTLEHISALTNDIPVISQSRKRIEAPAVTIISPTETTVSTNKSNVKSTDAAITKASKRLREEKKEESSKLNLQVVTMTDKLIPVVAKQDPPNESRLLPPSNSMIRPMQQVSSPTSTDTTIEYDE